MAKRTEAEGIMAFGKADPLGIGEQFAVVKCRGNKPQCLIKEPLAGG